MPYNDDILKEAATLPACGCASDGKDEANQDRVCAKEGQWLFVADGMGGVDGGEIAAAAAVCGWYQYIEDTTSPNVAQALFAAGAAIVESRKHNPDTSEQGATGAGILIGEFDEDNRSWFCQAASVGDARAYLYRHGTLMLLTEDDSLWSDSTDEEVISAIGLLDRATRRSEIRDVPWAEMLFSRRNVITNELGHVESPSTIKVHEFSAVEDDIVFVCSDGIHDNLAHQEMEYLIAQHEGIGSDKLAELLVASAKERSLNSTHLRAKRDDISVAVYCL